MKVELNKSTRERIFHAVLFELLANIIIALFLASVLQVSLLQSGMLSLISALTATVWNFIFNKIFDGLQRRYAFERSLLLRVLHAVAFEIGLIVTLTPVAMLLLNLPLIDAFFVEIGLVLFFLPYTLAYNWLYDWLRWTFYGQKRMEKTVE
ncbi:TPA: PACE efflux transporter [Enterobacter cancerogenus]|uniref:PACE efflux transporter n=1 Tax=Enterobacter cancerogenus TaxID=69218 RepID=UPI0012997B24|nr:PACE efflux transporter [Enterobacter cancerogenus]MRG34221.1 PACE efflux transporter [Enterobacter cancerogenus]